MAKTKISEFRAYSYITNKLKLKDWNTSNPNKVDKGEVWTQQECLENPEIKKCLGSLRPENIVKVNPSLFWVIEAKEGKSKLQIAIKEAQQYADKINNKSSLITCSFATGISGNEDDGFEVRNFININGQWKEIKLSNKVLSRFLSKNEILRLFSKGTSNLSRPELSVSEIVQLSKQINDILHIAKVEKEKRALYVAALLLSLNEDPTLSHKGNAAVFINDINSRSLQIFKQAGKEILAEEIKISTTSEYLDRQADALNKIINLLKEADLVNAATQSDILGIFFENFLRYGNTSKDLGIVLTPRHICWLASEALEISQSDYVYDCSVGTGGFLVSAFNKVKESIPEIQARRFASNNLFGIEAQTRVAVLAFINMYFRGDGKHNLKIDSCFNWHISKNSKSAKKLNF